jgi:enoyl-CoA hydratase/carnithine racemase
MAIEVSTESGLCTLRLARPEKQNALTLAMYSALASALRAAEADPAVLAVLVTGQPGVFCAGNDLGDFLANPPLGLDAPPYQFMQAVLALSRPLVAAVDGAAVGIGATLLLHCDLVYISDRSRLIYPFVPLGLAPEFGSSLLLPRRLGVQRASRALLLGEPIAAQEAVSMGLASECLAPEAVLPRALEAVARLNAAPASAAIAAKRLMRLREASEIQAAISIEARTFAAQLMNPATQATLRAVFEKRGGRT